MNTYRFFAQLMTASLFLFGTTLIASGHAAIVWAYAEGDTIYVEAFFANGNKIQDANVMVLDKEKKTLLEGKTDKEGKFSYKPVSKEAQTVVVRAGESHIGDFELTEEDLTELTLPKRGSSPTDK